MYFEYGEAAGVFRRIVRVGGAVFADEGRESRCVICHPLSYVRCKKKFINYVVFNLYLVFFLFFNVKF